CRLAAEGLGGRQVGQVRAVAFPGVDDSKAGCAGGVEHGADSRDDRAGGGNVLPAYAGIPARVEEVALHVDEHQRRPRPPGEREDPPVPRGQLDERVLAHRSSPRATMKSISTSTPPARPVTPMHVLAGSLPRSK